MQIYPTSQLKWIKEKLPQTLIKMITFSLTQIVETFGYKLTAPTIFT